MNSDEIIKGALLDAERQENVLHICESTINVRTLCEVLTAANARIAELEAEVASREQSGIEEHNEVHYWRDRAKKAELDLYALQSHDKKAMKLLEAAEYEAWMRCDCNYCAVRACARIAGTRRKCLAGDGNWKWQYSDHYEALKAQFSETT